MSQGLKNIRLVAQAQRMLKTYTISVLWGGRQSVEELSTAAPPESKG